MITITIDPGIKGALCIKYKAGVICYKCPETQKEMFDILKDVKTGADKEGINIICYLEKVHSMPGQGVKSTWTFACNFASWQMALISLSIPYCEISPQKWQRDLHLPKDKNKRKKEIKERMQKLYPAMKVTLYNSDALCMLDVLS